MTIVAKWTDSEAAEAVSEYRAGVSPEAIGEALGRTAKSVISKLANMKVYVKKEASAKPVEGEAKAKKSDVAIAIGKVLQFSDAETTSLVSASKTALDKIFVALAMSKPIED